MSPPSNHWHSLHLPDFWAPARSSSLRQSAYEPERLPLQQDDLSPLEWKEFFASLGLEQEREKDEKEGDSKCKGKHHWHVYSFLQQLLTDATRLSHFPVHRAGHVKR